MIHLRYEPRNIFSVFSKRNLLQFFEEVRKVSEGIPNEQLRHITHPFEYNGWSLEFSMIRKPEDKPINRRNLGYMISVD